jgi:ataxin-3
LQNPSSSSAPQRNTYTEQDTLEDDDEGEIGASDFVHHDRAYDDEDAAFQAALKASMEDVPADWVAPDLKKKKMNEGTEVKRELPVPPVAQSDPAPTENWKPVGAVAKKEEEDFEMVESTAPLSPTEELSQGTSILPCKLS